jgi:hypothetical protein
MNWTTELDTRPASMVRATQHQSSAAESCFKIPNLSWRYNLLHYRQLAEYMELPISACQYAPSLSERCSWNYANLPTCYDLHHVVVLLLVGRRHLAWPRPCRWGPDLRGRCPGRQQTSTNAPPACCYAPATDHASAGPWHHPDD